MLHEYLLIEVQVTFHHHLTTHWHKAWQLEDIPSQKTIQPIRYRTYHLTWIHTQVHQILLHRSRMNHQTASIINKDDTRKRTKINSRVKHVLITQSKSARSLQPSYLHPRKKSKVIKFKLYEDTLKHRVYLISFINSLKIVLSQFSETYMLLVDYPSIRGEYLLDYA